MAYIRGVPPLHPPRGFGQIVGQIFSVRVKKFKLSKTNLVASRHIKRGKASLTVDVRRSKTVLLCRGTLMKFQSTYGQLPGGFRVVLKHTDLHTLLLLLLLLLLTSNIYMKSISDRK